MVPMDVEDGTTDISVADNLFGTSVSPPNLKGGVAACDQVHFRPSTVLPYGPPSHNRAF